MVYQTLSLSLKKKKIDRVYTYNITDMSTEGSADVPWDLRYAEIPTRIYSYKCRYPIQRNHDKSDHLEG